MPQTATCIVARDDPWLRTFYLKWPWPHFYEVPMCGRLPGWQGVSSRCSAGRRSHVFGLFARFT